MTPWIIGWLIIPAISLYAPIHTAPIVDHMHQIGPAINHLDGTTWVGDNWGRVVLAAHSGGWFEHINELQTGDRIIVTTTTGTYEFEVTTMTVINTDTYLNPPDAYSVVLLTCLDRGVTWLAVNAKAVY